MNAYIWRNQILQNPENISPLKFGMSQKEIINILGTPDDVSTMKINGKPQIFKYGDIELHFGKEDNNGLFLIYSDYEVNLSIKKG